MLSDAEPEHVDILEEFGDALGMAFQLSDDIMDITSTQIELGKEPGQDLREGVYTLPVLTRWPTTSTARSSRGSSATGRPTARCWTGRSRSSARGARSSRARQAVTAEVERATGLARRLPDGPAQHALVQLAQVPGARGAARSRAAVSGRRC